jgi:hypothetical protein
MARKTLLSESEIRQFMKLANIQPLQEMGYDIPGKRDEEKDLMEEEEEEEGMEVEVGAEEAPAPEGGEEMDMDVEMGAEEPAGDMEMDMDMGDMGAEGGKEEQFADIVDKLADLLGLDADVEVGGEEEMEMGGEVMGDEGGDLEGAMDAPAGDDEDLGVEMDDEEMGEDEIVQEVARRVAARLLREKKQDAVATKLAERIFRRLTSK